MSVNSDTLLIRRDINMSDVYKYVIKILFTLISLSSLSFSQGKDVGRELRGLMPR